MATQKKNTSTAGSKNTNSNAVIFLHIFVRFFIIKAYNVIHDGFTKLNVGAFEALKNKIKSKNILHLGPKTNISL